MNGSKWFWLHFAWNLVLFVELSVSVVVRIVFNYINVLFILIKTFENRLFEQRRCMKACARGNLKGEFLGVFSTATQCCVLEYKIEFEDQIRL